MGTQIVLIFGSCGYETWDFLEPLRGSVTVFCADGGIHLARQAGFRPDYYIGDNDSGGRPEQGVEAVLLKPEKNITDMQAAYEHARSLGHREMVLTACTGRRQDHHLANLQLLETAARDGVDARILDPWNEIRYLPGGSVRFDGSRYRYFSLIPIDPELRGVRIENARYPLGGVTARRGDSLTVSNEPLDGPVTVSLEAGAAWLILSDPIA